MNLISTIRTGRYAPVHVPRTQFDRLWKWCLRHSESGTVLVKEISSYSSGYGVRRYRDLKRRGRAVPNLTVHPQWNILRERHEIGFTGIEWSYVY